MTGALPQFLSDVRTDGGQHSQIQAFCFPPGLRPKGARPLRQHHFIVQFHQTRNDGIKVESLKVMGDGSQGLVNFPPQLTQIFFARAFINL